MRPSLGVTSTTNINDVLEGHVALEIECIDRLYLNAYVPNLQVSGQVALFLTQHLHNPVPSPAIFEKIGNRFRRNVDAFARDNDIPVLHLKKPDRTRWDDRKLDHVRPHMDRAERDGRFGVVAIVAAQEFQWVFTGTNRATPPAVCFAFTKTERRVSTYYFYVLDPDFGPGFIKICTYFPYPAKVCLLTELRDDPLRWLVTVRSRVRTGRAAGSWCVGCCSAGRARANRGPVRAVSAA